MIDKIGREDIVEKIEYLINNLPKDQNFCLALNGAWGSGKSVVIQLLQEKLLEHPEYIVVHYDAWKNSFYSDPLIAMLYCILDTLEKSDSEEVSNLVTGKRTKQTAVAVATKVGAAVVDSIAEGSKIVKFIKSAITKIKATIKTYKETALTNNPEIENYKSYVSFLNQTIAQLNEITAQTFIENKQTRLIVLVDEIDRCLPNEQLVVLERLHHLFAVNNCAVVVALNKEAIHKNFEKNYGGNSEDYLRKFFQYNFELPTNATTLLKNRLIDLFYEVNDKRQEAIIANSVDFIVDDITKVASSIVSDNRAKKIDNRDVEKYVKDISCILESIIDYQPALLWFTMRLYLYRLFYYKLYQMIVDEKASDLIFLWELESFYGMKGEPANQEIVYIHSKGKLRDIDYKFYPNNNYNRLLYLLNLCRYRHNELMINEFIRAVANRTFDSKQTKGILENIQIILLEIDRYGD